MLRDSDKRKTEGVSFSYICYSVTQSCPTLRPHGQQQARFPCPSPSPRVCSKSCPLSWWCHTTISSSVIPLSSCLQSFPALASFPVNWLFTLGGQSIGASAWESVLPMNIQSRFLVGLTGLVSLTLESLSSTTVKKHQFSAAQFLCDPTLTSTHDFWKIHGFDYIALCQQGDISAF